MAAGGGELRRMGKEGGGRGGGRQHGGRPGRRWHAEGMRPAEDWTPVASDRRVKKEEG